MKTKLLVGLLVISLFLIAGCVKYVPGKIFVEFNPNVQTNEIFSLLEKYNLNFSTETRTEMMARPMVITNFYTYPMRIEASFKLSQSDQEFRDKVKRGEIILKRGELSWQTNGIILNRMTHGYNLNISLNEWIELIKEKDLEINNKKTIIDITLINCFSINFERGTTKEEAEKVINSIPELKIDNFVEPIARGFIDIPEGKENEWITILKKESIVINVERVKIEKPKEGKKVHML